jgi:spore coat polysaccharide biosynthesis protein SpsF
MKVVAIIQARMGSTRLPGKVMMDLAGEPMLARVVSRTRRAKTVDEVVVATTTGVADDPIARLCQERGWAVFRGSDDDVLDRYYQAALPLQADVVVRITSDCPLIEPTIIDAVVGELESRPGAGDYASNCQQRTYPRGLDVEAMTFTCLETAWREDHNAAWREHVTPYIYRNPGRFRLFNVSNDTDYSYMRWTVDTAEDLAFVRQIYGCFQSDGFTWREVLRLLEAYPEWLMINSQVQQKAVP